MSTQHTPGPWNACGVQNEEVRDTSAVLICKARTEHARLIAAAPDLLAQLEIARDRIKDMLSNDDGQAFKEAAKWLPGIDAAITKATGGAA